MFAMLKDKIEYAIEYIKFFIALASEFWKTEDKEDFVEEVGGNFVGIILFDILYIVAFGVETTMFRVVLSMVLSMLSSLFLTFISRFRKWLMGEPYMEVNYE